MLKKLSISSLSENAIEDNLRKKNLEEALDWMPSIVYFNKSNSNKSLIKTLKESCSAWNINLKIKGSDEKIEKFSCSLK